ncbi:hypothetical protein C8Q74DRAFT_1188059 [Fomes fomentarius]|nr:hypothetical protein C8Q74DRAFT_1188059 [Fomes fomentarius]
MDATTDADSQEELYAQIVDYFARNLVFNCTDLAVFALILFEYLVTFDREVHFAWRRRITWTRGIFLLNRYLSILEYLFVLGPMLPAQNLLVLIEHFPAFSGVRVYAISAGNSYITMTVVALAMVPVATNTVSVRSVATRSCMILSDAIVIVVTWIKTWSTVRFAQRIKVEMSFTSLVLREGILYFIIMLSLNVLQMVFYFAMSDSYALIIPFLNVMTPILVSRFFLDLDDLTSYSGTDKSCWDVPKMSALANSLSLQFVDPGSAVSVCYVFPLSSCPRLSPSHRYENMRGLR